VALDAARAVLRKKPSLLVIAPGVRAARHGGHRSRAWPRGRVGLRADQLSELHAEDLLWGAVAGLLDAIREAAEAGLPAPPFLLLMAEAFSTANGHARVEPFYEARLDAVAALTSVLTGALYQCDWAPHEASGEPLRLISDLPALVEGCHLGLPVRRRKRECHGGVGFSYCGPLPSSCGCGSAHRRRSSAEANVAEPMEAGPSAQLARRIETALQRPAAGPSALFGGECAALALLSGPPARGPPVPVRSAGGRTGWRPLDLYVGRNSRIGEPTWGNPFRVGKDGDARSCCAAYETWLRTNEVLWQRLEELRGRRLRCHCAPGAPCHSDVLVRLFCEKTAVLEVGVVTSVGSACAASGGRRVASAAVLGVGVVTPVGAAKSDRDVPAASLQHVSSALDGRGVPAAVLEVGVDTSVGSARTALGGRREASAAVLGVGVVTPVGAAKTVRDVPAASLQSSSSSLGGRWEAAAVPEVGVVTSVGSASSVRDCPAAALSDSHKTTTTTNLNINTFINIHINIGLATPQRAWWTGLTARSVPTCRPLGRGLQLPARWSPWKLSANCAHRTPGPWRRGDSLLRQWQRHAAVPVWSPTVLPSARAKEPAAPADRTSIAADAEPGPRAGMATYSAASCTCGSASSTSRPGISCGCCSARPSRRRWSPAVLPSARACGLAASVDLTPLAAGAAPGHRAGHGHLQCGPQRG